MTKHYRALGLSALFLVFAVAAAGITAPVLAQEKTYRVDPVAVTGDPAPGTSGLNFGCFDSMTVDLADSGIAAFVASTDLCPDYVPNAAHGIWAGTPAGVTLAAETGDPAPGGTAQVFSRLDGAFVNASGDMAIQATLDTSTFAPDNGVWINSAGTLSLLAMSGDPAPGTAGLSFSSVGLIGFNDLGVAAFSGYAADELNSLTGIWRGTPGSLQPIAVSGEPAPGTNGLYFSDIGFPTSTRSEFTAFSAATTDPAPALPEGIWSAGPTGVNLVAHLGDEAPGTGGRVFRAFSGGDLVPNPTVQDEWLYGERFDALVVNQAGDVAFTAYIDPLDPADVYSDAGLWIRNAAGSTSLIALTDDIAPGTAGEPYLYFNHINLNASGQVAFDASLDITDATRDHGIWVGQPGSLNLVVREGDPAPGTAGETFDSLVNGPSLNDAGEIAFFAKLRESGTYGLWAAAADGSLSLIARLGEKVEVKSGDYRTIELVDPLLGGLGGYSWFNTFNGSGQLAVFAGFTDGTYAVLLASPVSTTPNQPPVASAGPDQAIAENNTTVLDGSASTDPDGTVLAFSWSLNGTETGTEPKVTVGPLAIGVHAVTLTVTDRNGASASDDMILTVFANDPPIANAGPDQIVNYTQSITLDGTGSSDPEGGALSYYWHFGCWSTASGSGEPSDSCLTATGPNPTIWPPGITIFTGVLTVTDIHGASATDEITITVINDQPVASAGADQTVQTLDSVTLNGTGSSDPENDIKVYTWSIDGTLLDASGPTPVVGPFDAGVHTITLTVTDGGGAEATDQMVLTVLNRAPVASAGPDRTVNHSQTVALDGSGSSDPEGGALDYAWTLNGVQIGAGVNPVVGPFDVGAHALTLTVTDDRGTAASDRMVITVVNDLPVASAGPDKTVNHAQTVALDGSGSSDPEGGALDYAWTLNGAQIAAVANPTVGPFEVGIHTLTLTVTDNKGATASDSMVVTVVNEAPLANAGPDQTANHAQPIALDGAGSTDPEGGPLTYSWSIGGVEIATGPSPVVGPFEVGVHTVTLTVTDDHGATASDSMIVTVVNDAPVADAGPDQAISFKGKSTTVTLDGSASTDPEGGSLSYVWTLDGQTVGTGAALQLEVPAGVHLFTLTVTDDHGATATDSVVVTATKGGKGS